MITGFHSIHFSPLLGAAVDLEAVIVAAADAGFTSIGLDLASIDRFLGTGGTLAQLAEILEETGLDVSDVVALILRSGSDPSKLAEQLATIIDAVGARLCVAAVSEPIGHDRVVAGLSAGLDSLAVGGTRLAVEFGGYMGIRSLAEAVDVCAELGWERAGVLIDSYQCFRAGTALEEIAALDGSQIALVQFADASDPAPPPDGLMTESRNDRLLPGDGDLPLEDFVQAVASTGYSGPLTAEVLSRRVRASPPDSVAREAFAAMSRYTVIR